MREGVPCPVEPYQAGTRGQPEVAGRIECDLPDAFARQRVAVLVDDRVVLEDAGLEIESVERTAFRADPETRRSVQEQSQQSLCARTGTIASAGEPFGGAWGNLTGGMQPQLFKKPNKNPLGEPC